VTTSDNYSGEPLPNAGANQGSGYGMAERNNQKQAKCRVHKVSIHLFLSL
jgi:hypothetical protein